MVHAATDSVIATNEFRFVHCTSASGRCKATAVPRCLGAAIHRSTPEHWNEVRSRAQRRSAQRRRGASEWCALRGEKVKPAGKPGSVTGIAPYDGHSSRPWVTSGLQPPTRGLERATHRTPGLRVQHPPIWCCSGWRLPRFTPWAPDARTSPRAGPEDSSLWPYSSSSPKASLRLVRTAVSRHPALWSPDFPLRTLRHAATAWPASQPNFST